MLIELFRFLNVAYVRTYPKCRKTSYLINFGISRSNIQLAPYCGKYIYVIATNKNYVRHRNSRYSNVCTYDAEFGPSIEPDAMPSGCARSYATDAGQGVAKT